MSSSGVSPLPLFGPQVQYPTSSDEWNIFIRWLLTEMQKIAANASLGVALSLTLPAAKATDEQSATAFPLGLQQPPHKVPDEISSLIAYLLTRPPYRAVQGGIILSGTRVQRQTAYPPTAYGINTVFVETDSWLIYIVLPDPYVAGNPHQWFYADGIANIPWTNRDAPGLVWSGSASAWDYTDVNAKLIASDNNPGLSANGCLNYEVEVTTETTPDPTTWIVEPYYNDGIYQTLSSIPTSPGGPLFAFDKGYTVFAGGVGHTWLWTGTQWTWASGEAAGYAVDAGINPYPGWFQMIPTTGGTISCQNADGIAAGVGFAAYTSYNSLNPGWYKFARL